MNILYTVELTMTTRNENIGLGLLVSAIFAFSIVEAIMILMWLFTPSGQYYNSDTIPFNITVRITIDVLSTAWMWILTVIFWPFVTHAEPWNWSSLE